MIFDVFCKLQNLVKIKTINVTLTKQPSQTSPYTRYECKFQVIADSGYKIINLMPADSNNLFTEGINFNYGSNSGFAFGLSVLTNPPDTIQLDIGIYQIKNL